MPDKKIHDDYHRISDKRGNRQLRREVWVDKHGKITRSSLAYINHRLREGDNGRVVGYDDQHGYHQWHFFGKVEKVNFIS